MLGNAPIGAAPLGASGANPKPLGTYVLFETPGAFALKAADATMKGPATYLLLLDPGAFSLVGDGNAIEFPQYLMHADTGNLALAGPDNSFGRPSTGMSAGTGVFSLGISGSAGRGGHTFDLDTGAFQLGTDQGVAFFKGFIMAAGVGAFRLGGPPLQFTANRGMAAAGAVYSFKGTTRLTLRRNLRLALEGGSMALAGGDANWGKGYLLPLDPGTFRLTRGAATVAAYRRILAEERDLTLAAADARLLATHYLPTRSGTFDLLGEGTMALARVLPAAQGNLALRGADALLRAPRRLTLAVGAFTLARGDASLARSRVMLLQAGSLQLAGGPSSGQVPRTVLGEPATFALGRGDALISRDAAMVLEPGAMSLGGAARLDYSGNYGGITAGPRWVAVSTIEANDRTQIVDVEGRRAVEVA